MRDFLNRYILAKFTIKVFFKRRVKYAPYLNYYSDL